MRTDAVGEPLGVGPPSARAAPGTTRQRRPRVLLLAYACSPGRGSEPGVGWNRALQAARYFDTWVIVPERRASDIRRYLDATGGIPGLTFHVLPSSAPERLLARIPGLYYLRYNLWQRQAFRAARALHEQLHFDLVHQVTYCTFREPGYLWKLDAPFVWGPMGGTQNYPWRFLSVAGLAGGVSEAVRNVTNSAQLHWSSRIRRAARRAAAFLAANSTNQRDLARSSGLTPLLLLETGVAQVADVPRRRRAEAGLRILWCGDLLPFKGLPLLLGALARMPADVAYELHVIGEGPAKGRWQRLARRIGVEPHVRWIGRLPYRDVLEQYRRADVLAFTSLRDTSGNVVLEALAAGVPVVCLDHQGVGDIVTGRCGVKIPVTTPADVIGRLTEVLAGLARDATEWEQLSQGALARAREYLWSRQGERMAEIYRTVLSAHPGGGAPPRRPGAAHETRSAGRARNALEDLGKRSAGLIGVALNTVVGRRGGTELGILVYHRMAPRVPGARRPLMNVTPQRFRAQLVGLLSRGFRAWPLRRVLECHARGLPVPPRTFVVTFDDAFETGYTNAWPVLRELAVPATVFLSTAYLDQETPFPFDTWGLANRGRVPTETYRPLTTEQCREMARDGLIELGAHTHTHRDLRHRPEAFRRDLQTSVEILRSRFGQRDVAFAFPFGRRHTGFSSDALVRAARETGVVCGLTTESASVDPRSDPFGWGRFNVYAFDSGATLAAKLGGWYGWAPRVQKWMAECGVSRRHGRGVGPEGGASPEPWSAAGQNERYESR